MNKRAAFEILTVLFLLILLVWFYGGPDKVVRRLETTDSKPKIQAVPFSEAERIKEQRSREANSPPEEPKPVIDPFSHSGWINNGAYEVFGTVENIGEAVGRQITAHVTFKGNDNKPLGQAEALIERPRLAPGEKSAFKIIFRAAPPDDVKSYVLIMKAGR